MAEELVGYKQFGRFGERYYDESDERAGSSLGLLSEIKQVLLG
jgi:hypothetical protein